MFKVRKKISIELLGHIQKVDTPPFLFTRIQQTITNTYATKFSPRLTWTIGISFIFVLLINVMAINRSLKQSYLNNNLVKSMDLMPDNSIYK